MLSDCGTYMNAFCPGLTGGDRVMPCLYSHYSELSTACKVRVQTWYSTRTTLIDCGPAPRSTGYDPVSGTTTYYLSTWLMVCASGYTGTSSSVTCQIEGRWSTPSGCSIRDCGVPIAHTGYVVGTGSTTYGSTYSITCATGYNGTADSLTCQSDGSWSSQTGCNIASCSATPTQTGYIINAGASTYGSTRTVSCASGYSGTASFITCQASGSWNLSAGCVADCSSTPTQTGYTIAAGSSSLGSTRTVTCATGYTGTATSITCTLNSWTSSTGCTPTPSPTASPTHGPTSDPTRPPVDPTTGPTAAPESCSDTQVPHSDYAIPGSLSSANGAVFVLCDSHFTGSAFAVCASSQWTLPECVAAAAAVRVTLVFPDLSLANYDADLFRSNLATATGVPDLVIVSAYEGSLVVVVDFFFTSTQAAAEFADAVTSDISFEVAGSAGTASAEVIDSAATGGAGSTSSSSMRLDPASTSSQVMHLSLAAAGGFVVIAVLYYFMRKKDISRTRSPPAASGGVALTVVEGTKTMVRRLSRAMAPPKNEGEEFDTLNSSFSEHGPNWDPPSESRSVSVGAELMDKPHGYLQGDYDETDIAAGVMLDVPDHDPPSYSRAIRSN